jgi:hypothetical protein
VGDREDACLVFVVSQAHDCYERGADPHEAFLHLACALVCFGRWVRRGEDV